MLAFEFGDEANSINLNTPVRDCFSSHMVQGPVGTFCRDLYSLKQKETERRS
jgi:hypothetical protein